MANNPNVLDNLTPFKKGQSWNPNWRPMSFKNEFKRMKPSGVKWIENEYPLIYDYPLDRKGCKQLVISH